MKIVKSDNNIFIEQLLKRKELLLKEHKLLILDSMDHADHIATYIAWKNVGGNIFVVNPGLPEVHRNTLLDKLNKLKLDNNIVFHTSGSTGIPKLVIHSETQMLQAQKASENAIGWSNNTNWLNLIPAPTSGFWHIVIPALYYNNSNIVLGSPQTLAQDIEQQVNEAVFVPGLIDMLVSKGINLSLGKFNKISVGASQVQKRHAEYVFTNGCQTFNHLYGTTEICSPVLHRQTTSVDDKPEYLSLRALCDNSYRIQNNELQMKGKSLCSNVQDFDHEDDWYRTNDLWEQQNNLIRFIGRANDVVKVNGCQCSLLEIENTIENNFDLGDCLAVPQQTMGIEYIELQHTSGEVPKDIKNILEDFLPSYAIPRKFLKVEKLDRTNLGKKIRIH